MFEKLIELSEYTELEKFIRAEIVDKPILMNFDNKTAEMIAIEVRACELAAKKIDKVLRKIRTISQKKTTEIQSWK